MVLNALVVPNINAYRSVHIDMERTNYIIIDLLC